ncbi:MAG: hypothetical protein JST54_33050 [Deltaproteobacteria bacterium]|nr:hypothetical protein [Deltaproteobacteria bacterium]
MVTRALMVAAILLAGCSGGGATSTSGTSGSSCPRDLPQSCRSPEPSYANDVAPLVQAHCVQCHGPNGVSSDRPLGSYPQLFALRSDALDQVYNCRMPEAPQSLTDAERQTLLDWFVCGAPDN